MHGPVGTLYWTYDVIRLPTTTIGIALDTSSLNGPSLRDNDQGSRSSTLWHCESDFGMQSLYPSSDRPIEPRVEYFASTNAERALHMWAIDQHLWTWVFFRRTSEHRMESRTMETKKQAEIEGKS